MLTPYHRARNHLRFLIPLKPRMPQFSNERVQEPLMFEPESLDVLTSGDSAIQ